MKYLTREVKIGIAGVVALALVFLGINFLRGINLFEPSNYYFIEFSDAKGLSKSSPVYADGYNIGIVSNITYNYKKQGSIIVEVQVDDELRIPKGSSAELVTEILGGCKLNLLLANNPRERMMPGDTIKGRDDLALMDQAAEMLPKVELMLAKADSLLTTLNKIAADPNIARILANTEHITGNLNKSTEQINQLLAQDVPQLTRKFNTVGDQVITFTNTLNALNLQATLNKVDTTMSHLQLATAQLNNKNNNLGLLLNDTLLYTNINTTIGSADSLLRDLKQHPKRYVHFSIFGRKGN